MKFLKMLGLAAVAAMALMSVLVGTASGTTLEVEGATKNEAVTITSSLKAGTTAILKDTTGLKSNKCTSSHVHGTTEAPFTGATVTGSLSTLSFSSCTREPVTADKMGKFHITWTSGTNGTVTSSGAEITTGSPFGTLNCKTNEGTHLGTLTGVKEGNATMDINAVFFCSGISSTWEATYSVTSPSGLGVRDVPVTALEVGGVTKTEAVTITASLKSGTSAALKDTTGLKSNTCTSSHVHGTTEAPFTGATVTGSLSTLSFSSCTREPVTADKMGKLHITWTSGTNGTVTSSGAEITTGSPFGTLNCKTNEGTHLGTLTGVKEGNATMDINAVLFCSGISSTWEATYSVTSPSGLGVGS